VIYGDDGSAALEVDAAGDGHFAAVNHPGILTKTRPASK
jgi:hypothetical protein